MTSGRGLAICAPRSEYYPRRCPLSRNPARATKRHRRPALSAAQGLCGAAFGDEAGGGGLDPLLQLGHEGAAVETRGDGLQELDRDPPRALHEAAAAPEQAGVQGHRHHRQVEGGVEGGDAGLVVGRVVGRAAGAFGEDQDRARPWRRRRGHPRPASATRGRHRRGRCGSHLRASGTSRRSGSGSARTSGRRRGRAPGRGRSGSPRRTGACWR